VTTATPAQVSKELLVAGQHLHEIAVRVSDERHPQSRLEPLDARPGVVLAPLAGLPVRDRALVGALGLQGELSSASRIASSVDHTWRPPCPRRAGLQLEAAASSSA
jgi:hypothetical protein